MDIQPILQQIRQGNRQAYAPIVAHFQRPLFGYLGRMGLTQAQAEDLAQETFLRAWQALAQYDPQQAAFSTWLFTIAHRLALNELARAANKHEVVATALQKGRKTFRGLVIASGNTALVGDDDDGDPQAEGMLP